MISVKILDRTYTVRQEIRHNYQAYCEQCNTLIQGPNGTQTWATKRPAVRAAKRHLEIHPSLETFLDRITADASVKVVDIVAWAWSTDGEK